MIRVGYVFFFCIILACNNEKAGTKEPKGFVYEQFSKLFLPASLPYQLTDAGLEKRRDTTLIRSIEFAQFIPDSIKNKAFTKGAKPKYYPIVKIQVPEAEAYFLVKAVAGSKRAALLVSFDKEGNYAATFPFLLPDADAATSQNSSMDKSYTITRNVIRKKGNEITEEGKDVYVYNNDAKQFTLIMTDLLDEKNAEVINPIDTLPHTRKFGGDYVQGKRNIVSIRNGRTPNQALTFVHLEKNNGECTGELKGEIIFTSSTTAVYRQGGDPCVLQFSFSSSSVTLREEQGCGNHRGLDCPLEGTYSKKKEPKPKSSAKKSRKK